MARVEKKTRKKGLPAKILLQHKNDTDASYPIRSDSTHRISEQKINFNDNNTIIFTGSVETVIAGINLESNGNEISSSLFQNTYRDFLSGSKIIVTSSIVKGVSDSVLEYSNTSDTIVPYKDFSNPAVDGKSTNDPFYTTGSSIEIGGENFTSPLWSKTKIEIDISSKEEHTVGISNYNSASFFGYDNGYTESNYPMMYWNPEEKIWQGIGTGKTFRHYQEGFTGVSTQRPELSSNSNNDLSPNDLVQKFLEEQCIGFRWSMYDPKPNNHFFTDIGEITNAFGFPFAKKFEATSSNLIPMSNYIKKPFLVEKMFLIFTGALEQMNYFGTTQGSETGPRAWTSGTITNFFVLNQRGPSNFKFRQLNTFFRTGSKHPKLNGTTSPIPPDGLSTTFHINPNKRPLNNSLFSPISVFNFENNFFDSIIDGNSLNIANSSDGPSVGTQTSFGRSQGRFLIDEPFENKIFWSSDPIRVGAGAVGSATNSVLTASDAYKTNYQITGEMTIEFVFKFENPTTISGKKIIHCSTIDDTETYWGILIDSITPSSPARPFFKLGWAQSGYSTTDPYWQFSGSLGKWYHFIVTRRLTGGNWLSYLHVNGETSLSNSLPGSSSATSTDATLMVNGYGAATTKLTSFNATNFAKLGIYDTWLSAEPRRQMYSSSFLYPSYSVETTNTIRDFIGGLQIASINLSGVYNSEQKGWGFVSNSLLETKHRLLYEKSDIIATTSSLKWSGKLFGSSSVYSFKGYPLMPSYREFAPNREVVLGSGSVYATINPSSRAHWLLKSGTNDIIGIGDVITKPGRNGIDSSSGRSLLAELDYIDFSDYTKYEISDSVGNRNIQIGAPVGMQWNANIAVPNFGNATKKINPYILFPEDNLILGFQVPINQVFLSGSSSIHAHELDAGPKLQFASGESKLILYGSYVTNGHEYHDMFSEPNDTVTIHEAIE